MSDAIGAVEPLPDTAGLRVEVADVIEVDISNPSGEPLRVVTRCHDDVIDDSNYGKRVFADRTIKGQYLNTVQEQLNEITGVDAAGIRSELAAALSAVGERWGELGVELLPGELQDLVDGTHYPIHVYVGDPTEWVVTITAWGETHTITFTTSDIQGGAAALETKILNEWVEFVDVTDSDWETIRDEWKQHIEKHDGGLSEDEALAEVLLDHLRSAVIRVDAKDALPNDKANVWLDEGNSVGYAPDDDGDEIEADIAWMRNDMVREAFSRAGGKDTQVSQASTALQKVDATYGPAAQKRWDDGTQRRFYPFDPDALALDQRPQWDGSTAEESEVVL